MRNSNSSTDESNTTEITNNEIGQPPLDSEHGTPTFTDLHRL